MTRSNLQWQPSSPTCHPIPSPWSIISPYPPSSLSNSPWLCASPLACSRGLCYTQAFSLIASGHICPLFFSWNIHKLGSITPLVRCHRQSSSIYKKVKRKLSEWLPNKSGRHSDLAQKNGIKEEHKKELEKPDSQKQRYFDLFWFPLGPSELWDVRRAGYWYGETLKHKKIAASVKKKKKTSTESVEWGRVVH